MEGQPQRPTDAAGPPDRSIDHRVLLGLFLVLFGIYGLTTGGHSTAVDDELKFDTTRALVHGDAAIPLTASNQMVLYRERPDGTYASVYGLGQSIAGAPFYVVGAGLARTSDGVAADVVLRTTVMLTNPFLGALLAVFLALLCREVGASANGSVVLALVYGLGTYAWPIMKTFLAEPGTALCITAGLWLVFRAARTRSTALFVVGGAVFVFVAVFRISAIAFLPLVGLYVLAFRSPRSPGRRIRDGAAFTIGAAASLGLLLLTNEWRYGRWLEIGYETIDTSYPPLEGAFNLFFSTGKSLFLFAPVAAVAVAGLVVHWRRVNLQIVLFLAIIALNVYTVARLTVWSGDHAWGPRYLQIVLPLFVASAAIVMDRVRWRRAVVVAGVVGFLLPGLLGVLIATDVYFIEVAEHAETPADAEIRFGWSRNQMLGHLKLLPEAFEDLVDSPREPFTGDPATFYGYFGRDPRVDVWWLWVPETGGSPVTYLLLVPTVGALVVGARLLWVYRDRWRSGPSNRR